jgi:hypothetical protein
VSPAPTEVIARIRASLPGTSVTREGGKWVARGPWGSAEARLLPDLEARADEKAKGWNPGR